MIRTFKRGRWCLMVLAALFLGPVGWTDVSSPEVTVIGYPGQQVSFSLDVSATVAVAGINGELTYDSTVLSNPEIQRGLGALGFNVLGNPVAPGQFNFVVYADPTANLNLTRPIAFFVFDISDQAVGETSTIVTYEMEAAGSAEGISLTNDDNSDIQFGNVTIEIGGNAVEDWMIYE